MIPEHPPFDVVILGAGAAGLTIARELAGTGLSIALVEARDRIGGRVHTIHLPGWSVPLEAGAEFIHGQPRDIWNIVCATNLAAYEVSERHWHAPQGRLEPIDFTTLWDRIFAFLPRRTDEDCSFADFLSRTELNLTAEEQVHVITFVEAFHAADSRLISCHWLRETGEAIGRGGNAPAFRISNGYDRVIHWLLSGIDRQRTILHLNTMASQIRWRPGHVEVEVVSGTGLPMPPFPARCAVITLPWGVLRAAPHQPGAVQFQPDLAEKWEAASGLQMGSVVKMALRFREAFWESTTEGRMGLLDAPDEPVPAWWTTDPMRTPILTGWVGGPRAERLAELQPGEILRRALQSLGRTLREPPERLASLLQDWHVFNWQFDIHARGAYSYLKVGGAEAPLRLAEPVADTLYFAGEATHQQLNGTVGGAIASGVRAAKQIRARFRLRDAMAEISDRSPVNPFDRQTP